ncbi:MAG: hydrogenase iron-sulfur subunit [Thermoplasmata archaeon]|nr:MAG: hydrogenase iron-sulfur subunit [Thermoplasmata archaeon]
MTEFEPKIIGFLCNWCSYAGADLAGVSRFQYPPNIRIVRVMCSGRVDPLFVIEMFLQGADGVFIGGCHPGDCHYMEGNYHTEKRVSMLRKILAQSGLEPVRLGLEWIAASEGERFANTMKQFTEQIKALGPNPVSGDKPDMKTMEALYVARSVVEDFRLRTLVGKELNLIEKGNVYDEKITQARIEELLDNAIIEELLRTRILLLAKDEPQSVKGLSKMMNVPSQEVLKHIVTLRDRNLIKLEGIEGTTPMYKAQTQEVEA